MLLNLQHFTVKLFLKEKKQVGVIKIIITTTINAKATKLPGRKKLKLSLIFLQKIYKLT